MCPLDLYFLTIIRYYFTYMKDGMLIGLNSFILHYDVTLTWQPMNMQNNVDR